MLEQESRNLNQQPKIPQAAELLAEVALPLYAVVLAAGRSKRMGGVYPKSALKLAGKPIITYIVENLNAAKISLTGIIVVVGYGADIVKKVLHKSIKFNTPTRLDFAYQKQPLGTAHALSIALPLIKKREADLLVMCGDTPFIRRETIGRLVKYHRDSNAHITILTAELEEPSGYGRIIRDEKGKIVAIVEHKDATFKERAIKEVNSGLYILRLSVILRYLEHIKPDNVQGEYYLTDLVRLAIKGGEKIVGFKIDNPLEIVGINSPVDFKKAEEIFLGKKLKS